MTVQDQLNEVYKKLEPIFTKIYNSIIFGESFTIEIRNDGEVIFKIIDKK